MNIIVTYDVESERTRTINGFLQEYLEWEQQSVFHGDVSDEEYESIEDWIRSFVETDELVKIYNMTDDETITIGDEQNTSTDTMTDDSDMTFPIASLSVDAVRDKNEHVEERLTYLEQEVETNEQSDDLTAVRETLAIDADDSVVEAIESLQADHERLVNELDGDGDGDDDGDGDGDDDDDDDSSVKVLVNDVHDGENDYTNRRDGVNPLEEY